MPPRLRPHLPRPRLHLRHITTATFPPPLPAITDYISPTPTHLLKILLSPYLRTPPPPPTHSTTPQALPPGHHLLYFPPHIPDTQLLPDGSDSAHSPDTPHLTRRMWAGGKISFNAPINTFSHATLKEEISSVSEKNGKTYVTFLRKVHVGGDEVAVLEKRDLVFLPCATTPQRVRGNAGAQPLRAEFSRAFRTNTHLAFRFSALTYNAHRIHYDVRFARDVEGHRGTLVHGPLSVVFMLELLRAEGVPGLVREFGYRCLAPVVVGEEYKICGKLKSRKTVDGKVEAVYSLWTETERGYAVMGTATVDE